jgi:hypothetical protein
MTTQDQPLWRVMQAAYFEGRRPGSCEHRGYAAEIEVLRDLIVPEEPEPFTPSLPRWLRWRSLLWCGYNQRQRIRSQQLAVAAELEGVG